MRSLPWHSCQERAGLTLGIFNDLHENAQLKGQKAKASDIVKKGKPVLRQWQLKPLCKLSVKDQTFLLKKVRYVRHCPLNHCQVYPVFKFVWDDLFNCSIFLSSWSSRSSSGVYLPGFFFSLLSPVVEERFHTFRKIVNIWKLIISACFYSSFLGGNLRVKLGRNEICCLRSKISKTCPGGHC